MRKLVLALLLFGGFASRAGATSCWSAPPTWAYRQVPAYTDFNTLLKDNPLCLKTEIGDDGKIQRDLMLFSSTTTAGNATTVETTVNSYPMPANTFSPDGSALVVEGAFSCAANANTKTVRIYIGTSGYSVSSSTCNNSFLHVRAVFMRSTSTLEKLAGETTGNGAGSQMFMTGGGAANPTENLANALAITFTVQGTATNDLQEQWVKVRLERHP